MHIPLHKPFWGKRAEQAVLEALRAGNGVADGPYSHQLRRKLTNLTGATYALPVTNCTHAMEIAVACLGAKSGDEVIVPSFTLASTATSVMIRGAAPVFADIDPVTFSLDPNDVEKVITKKTVGIITVHYAGMASSNFDKLRALAKKYKLWLVEDAAHCIGSYYKGKHLGTFGDAGALSFHGTKNIAAGEGGALLVKKTDLMRKMEIFRAIGTDRYAFLQGKVSLYQWVGEGSSYMLSDILANLINIQLDQIAKINKERNQIANNYNKLLKNYSNLVQLPTQPQGMTQPNWHIYGLKFPSVTQTKLFISEMRKRGIEAGTHYVPLHTAPMGKKLGAHKRRLPVTDEVARTLVRMPIYAGMTQKEVAYTLRVVQTVFSKL